MARSKFARFYFELITDSKISNQKTIWQISDYIKSHFSIYRLLSQHFFDDLNLQEILTCLPAKNKL